MYSIKGYYDEAFRGLADSGQTNNWHEVELTAHSYLSTGLSTKITNLESGEEVTMNPDEYFENFNGEFPYKPEDLERADLER